MPAVHLNSLELTVHLNFRHNNIIASSAIKDMCTMFHTDRHGIEQLLVWLDHGSTMARMSHFPDLSV
jgi:hypothetical protein